MLFRKWYPFNARGIDGWFMSQFYRFILTKRKRAYRNVQFSTRVLLLSPLFYHKKGNYSLRKNCYVKRVPFWSKVVQKISSQCTLVQNFVHPPSLKQVHRFIQTISLSMTIILTIQRLIAGLIYIWWCKVSDKEMSPFVMFPSPTINYRRHPSISIRYSKIRPES